MKLKVLPNGVSMQPETHAERCQLDSLKHALDREKLEYFDWGSAETGYGTTLVMKMRGADPPPMRYQYLEVYGA